MDLYELLNKKSPENVRLNLAQRFKACRKIKGITQQELAVRSGVPYGTIRQFEQKGKISLESLILLSEALNMMGDFEHLFIVDKHRDLRKLMNEDRKH